MKKTLVFIFAVLFFLPISALAYTVNGTYQTNNTWNCYQDQGGHNICEVIGVIAYESYTGDNPPSYESFFLEGDDGTSFDVGTVINCSGTTDTIDGWEFLTGPPVCTAGPVDAADDGVDSVASEAFTAATDPSHTEGGLLGSIFGDAFNISILDDGDNNVFIRLSYSIIDLLVPALMGLFVLMFIIGGYLYMFSAGNEEMARKGKKVLTYAIGGLVLAILSNVIVNTSKTVLDGIAGTDSLEDAIGEIITYLLTGAGAVAVLFLVVGGLQMITSHGNVDQVRRGKKTVTYSVIGLTAILLSYAVYYFIYNTLTEIF